MYPSLFVHWAYSSPSIVTVYVSRGEEMYSPFASKYPTAKVTEELGINSITLRLTDVMVKEEV